MEIGTRVMVRTTLYGDQPGTLVSREYGDHCYVRLDKDRLAYPNRLDWYRERHVTPLPSSRLPDEPR